VARRVRVGSALVLEDQAAGRRWADVARRDHSGLLRFRSCVGTCQQSFATSIPFYLRGCAIRAVVFVYSCQWGLVLRHSRYLSAPREWKRGSEAVTATSPCFAFRHSLG
jgi:hypothetical protein